MIITVNQLNRYLKGMIECEPILNSLTVEGELSDVRFSGSLFFVLRDNEAQIDCISNKAAASFKDGDYVLVKGKIGYYERRGKISFIVQEMIHTDRFGAKYKEFLLLKEEFRIKGYFDASSKKEICKFPKRIGVVTSPTGSVIRDIIKVVKRRYPISDIIIYPAKVQGIDAPKELTDGVTYFSEAEVDTIIVARGGGSVEDMACFNDRELVEAIYACKKPIISAVGHETDFTLCDFVADCRASTPSVAAELATPDISAIIKSLLISLKSSYAIQKKRLNSKQGSLNGKIWRIYHKYENVYIFKKQSIVRKLRDSEKLITKKLKKASLFIHRLKNNGGTIEKSIRALEQSLGKKIEILNNNPLSLFKKGYVKLSGKFGFITRTTDVNKGDILSAALCDGKILVEVTDIEKRR